VTTAIGVPVGDFRNFAYTWVIPVFLKERRESGGGKGLKRK
jgi:hypothetical protein